MSEQGLKNSTHRGKPGGNRQRPCHVQNRDECHLRKTL